MKKIGLLGGTFDPIHLGHIGLAETAICELGLDMLYLMPARVQPFKLNKKTADAKDRVNMAELAVRNHPELAVTTYEVFDTRVSYTYDTISRMKQETSDCQIYFIMGTDSLMSIENWYRGQELLGMCSFAVGLRSENDRKKAEEKAEYLRDEYGADVSVLQGKMLPISSTEIKKNFLEGTRINSFVGDDVERYINEHGLYI